MAYTKERKRTPQAQQLRRDMTPQEKKLWYEYLRDYPVKIYRQRVIGQFIVDFYCYAAKLVIELDGAQHYTSNGMVADAERTALLTQMGLKVIRFENIEVDEKFHSVCSTIHSEIQSRCRNCAQSR